MTKRYLAALLCAATTATTACASDNASDTPQPVAQSDSIALTPCPPVGAPGFVTPTVPSGFVYKHDVAIGSGGECPITMDIVAPASNPGQPLPVLVYIHGGGWSKGDKNDHAIQITHYAPSYVGVAVNYRLTYKDASGVPRNLFPAQIEDVKLAIRFLRAKAADYFLDPDRIGVWGTSAGGHLAALLGTSAGQPALEGNGGWSNQSSAVNAVVDFSGPADFTTEFADAWNSVTALLGDTACDAAALAHSATPGTYATSSDPPFLVLHGDTDTTVPCRDSTALTRELRAAGVRVTHGLVSGAGHSLKAAMWTDTLAKAFLSFHLRGVGTEPALPAEALDPVAWWKLDEAASAAGLPDALDSSAEYPGVSLTRRGAAQPVTAPGHTGRALQLPDGYSYLSNKDANTSAQVRALNFLGSMSVELWVKLDKLPSEYMPDDGDSAKLVYRVNSTSKAGYELYVTSLDNKPHFKLWVNSTTRVDIAAATALSKGLWHHIVGTYDGSELQIYVDGAAAVAKPWTTGIGSAGDTDIKLGGTTSSTSNASTGIIGWLDEVRLYKRALTAGEVSARFAALEPGVPGQPLCPGSDPQ